MRRALIGLFTVLVITGHGVTAVRGEHQPQHGTRTKVEKARNGGAIETTLAGGQPGSTAAPAPPTGRTSRARGRGAPVPTVRKPFLTERERIGQCVAYERVRAPSETAASVGQGLVDSMWEPVYGSYPLCPGTEAPADSPAATAAEFWTRRLRDTLPRPRPAIAPGYMLAGKTAYLEANTKVTERFDHATPLGRLVIDAVGPVHVDWGDGSTSGPFSEPGRPWPDGTITHAWTDAGRYDIVVTQRWSATWALAGRTGTLLGLTTEGRLEDFEARQLQAVRNR